MRQLDHFDSHPTRQPTVCHAHDHPWAFSAVPSDWRILMRTSTLAPLAVLLLTAAASAQIKRDSFAYKVGPRAVISVRNQYGRITVTPSAVDRVVVNVTHSDAVEILHQQNENRIELITGAQDATGAKG